MARDNSRRQIRKPPVRGPQGFRPAYLPVEWSGSREREAKVYDFETVRVLTSLDGNIAYAKFYNITVWRGNFGSGYGKYFHKAKAEEVKTIILADECERLDYEYQDKLKVVIEETEYLIGELTLFLKYEKEMRERGVL